MQLHQTADLRAHQNLFHQFWSHITQDIDFTTKNAGFTQIHIRRGTDRWDPGVVAPRVSHAAPRPIFGRTALADGEVSSHGVSTSVLPTARRTQGCPWIGRRMTGAPPTSMHGSTAALLAVARMLRCGRARASAPPSFLIALRT